MPPDGIRSDDFLPAGVRGTIQEDRLHRRSDLGDLVSQFDHLSVLSWSLILNTQHQQQRTNTRFKLLTVKFQFWEPLFDISNCMGRRTSIQLNWYVVGCLPQSYCQTDLYYNLG